MIQEAVEERGAGSQVSHHPVSGRAPLGLNGRWSAPEGRPGPALPRLRGPCEAAHHLLLLPVSCLPFFITQQMTYLIGVPLLHAPAASLQ